MELPHNTEVHSMPHGSEDWKHAFKKKWSRLPCLQLHTEFEPALAAWGSVNKENKNSIHYWSQWGCVAFTLLCQNAWHKGGGGHKAEFQRCWSTLQGSADSESTVRKNSMAADACDRGCSYHSRQEPGEKGWHKMHPLKTHTAWLTSPKVSRTSPCWEAKPPGTSHFKKCLISKPFYPQEPKVEMHIHQPVMKWTKYIITIQWNIHR